MRHEDVPVLKIQTGDRHRSDLGDTEALARNISQVGLLQPIGLDKYYNLIFGERRLFACAVELKWETIPCVILDMESVLQGEYAENEFRKAFTPSERASIGKAIEAEVAATQRRGGDRKSKGANAPLDRHEDKGRTTDIAAKRAGFTSRETFERAKKVVDKGAPEVVAAMDSGKLSISAAAAIASQPEEEQKRILEMPVAERSEVVRRVRKTAAEREKDQQRANDLRVFRGLYDAVKEIAGHQTDAKATWAGLNRVSAYDFSDFLRPAIKCLIRIDKEHPNAARKPEIVSR